MTWEETVRDLKDLSASAALVTLQTPEGHTVSETKLMVLGAVDTPLTIESESHGTRTTIHQEGFEDAEWLTEGSARLLELRFRDGARMRVGVRGGG